MTSRYGTRRLAELDQRGPDLSAAPVVLGGLLVVPIGLIAAMTGRKLPSHPVDTRLFRRPRSRHRHGGGAFPGLRADRPRVRAARLRHESRPPGDGPLRFIKVKGRVTGADIVTVTKNEILYSFNKPATFFILALVEFIDDERHRVLYLRRPFERSRLTTDFNGASVDFSFRRPPRAGSSTAVTGRDVRNAQGRKIWREVRIFWNHPAMTFVERALATGSHA